MYAGKDYKGDAHSAIDTLAERMHSEVDGIAKAGYRVTPASIRIVADGTLSGWLSVTMKAER